MQHEIRTHLDQHMVFRTVLRPNKTSNTTAATARDTNYLSYLLPVHVRPPGRVAVVRAGDGVERLLPGMAT